MGNPLSTLRSRLPATSLAAIVGRYVVGGLLLNILFAGLLAATLVLSSDARIGDHLRTAFDDRVLPATNYPTSGYGHSGHSYDMFTECIALSTNLSNQDRSVLYRLAADPAVRPAADLNDRLNNPANVDQCGAFHAALVQGSAHANAPYPRFWHGYQVYTRLILSAVSVANMHKIDAVLVFGALLFLGLRLNVRFGGWALPALALPFVAIGDLLTTPLLATHTLALATILASAAAVALVLEQSPDPALRRLLPVVFVAGAVFNFVSYLNNPPLAPTLMCFPVIASRLGDGNAHRYRRAIMDAGLVVFVWFAGWTLTWVFKWVLAAAVLGPNNVMGDVLTSISGRVYSSYARAGSLWPLQTTWIVLGEAHLRAAIVIAFGIAFAVLGRRAAARQLRREDIADFLILQLPLLLPIGWVDVMRVHSLEHAGFVFRDFIPLVTGPVLAAAFVTRKSRRVAVMEPVRAAPTPMAIPGTVS